MLINVSKSTAQAALLDTTEIAQHEHCRWCFIFFTLTVSAFYTGTVVCLLSVLF